MDTALQFWTIIFGVVNVLMLIFGVYYLFLNRGFSRESRLGITTAILVLFVLAVVLWVFGTYVLVPVLFDLGLY